MQPEAGTQFGWQIYTCPLPSFQTTQSVHSLSGSKSLQNWHLHLGKPRKSVNQYRPTNRPTPIYWPFFPPLGHSNQVWLGIRAGSQPRVDPFAFCPLCMACKKSGGGGIRQKHTITISDGWLDGWRMMDYQSKSHRVLGENEQKLHESLLPTSHTFGPGSNWICH